MECSTGLDCKTTVLDVELFDIACPILFNHEIHETHEMDANQYLAQGSSSTQRLWSIFKKKEHRKTASNFEVHNILIAEELTCSCDAKT